MHVVLAQRACQVLGGTDQQVHALLLPDDADIAQHRLGPLAVGLLSGPGQEGIDARRGAHDEDVFRGHPPAADRDVTETAVGGHGHAGTGKGHPLPDQHDVVEQPALLELGLEELGADVVVIEHVAHAPEPVPQGQKENQVGRVAALDHVEPARLPDLAGQAEPVPDRMPVFARIGHRPRMRLGRFGVAVDVDAVDFLVGRGPAAAHGRDHRNVVSRLDQCRGFEPHAPVQRHRQVLDHDEDMAVLGGAHERALSILPQHHRKLCVSGPFSGQKYNLRAGCHWPSIPRPVAVFLVSFRLDRGCSPERAL